mmetsp:Transcript_11003/g.21913  ORF Transcript_11003/g.21913 Transcript_11003/m.21913 type:complete len:151 (-) Transcript_11003:59-511(-)
MGDTNLYQINLARLRNLLVVPTPEPVPPHISPLLGTSVLHPPPDATVASASDVAELHHDFLETLMKDIKAVNTSSVPASHEEVAAGSKGLVEVLAEKARLQKMQEDLELTSLLGGLVYGTPTRPGRAYGKDNTLDVDLARMQYLDKWPKL